MAERREDGTYVCQYCGLTSPKGHWRPKTWIEKHEENCPSNPKHNQEQ
jgi:ribosomal protein L37AE/L43A|tara:strand:- start:2780 stop:2923 length:144 start_codon:yes stop_codon:yes gene_type:complete